MIRTKPDTRWTDRCFIIGPEIRWTQDDYEDLQHAYPEVFLGYTVWLLTPDMIVRGMGRGVVPKKVILLHGVYGSQASQRHPFWNNDVQMWRAMGAKLETWFVHRGEGIWRMSK